MKFSSVVIFGGAGYIGSYFAAHLLEEGLAENIVLADITKVKEKIWPSVVLQAEKEGKLRYVECDVRKPLDPAQLPDKCDLIANFAAVHREPGHEDYEYYETNLAGAENVCAWAAAVGCPRIIFTSSIAPYGISPEPKTEKSLTVPVTAYGGSKLAAEKMHQTWQAGDPENRYLSIVRPGVVFGPGEDGNVPRMIRALRKGYFFYTGNKDTVKAGGYIKELPRAMVYVLERQEQQKEHVALYNFTLKTPPTFGEYVNEIRSVAGISRDVANVPFPLLLTASYMIETVARPLGIKHPFSPVRVRKLVRPNHIIPNYLIENEYPFAYDLHGAMEDWKNDAPQDWGVEKAI